MYLPIEPNAFYYYNVLQQIAYFSLVIILVTLVMLTGICISLAIENGFHCLPKLIGNLQGTKFVNFLVKISYVIFIIIHVSLVAAIRLVCNLNRIT